MRTSKTRDVVVGLIAIVTFVIVAVFSLVWFVRNVSFGTPVAILAAVVPLAIALATPAVTSAFEKRRETEASQRTKKAEVYNDFMSLWFDNMLLPMIQARHAGGAVAEPDQGELIPKMNQFTKNVILWGGDDVLKSYAEYRRQLTTKGDRPSPLATMTQLKDLFYEFRKDLGYRNQGLKPTDLLTLFINDTENVKAATAASPALKAGHPRR